MRRYIIKYKVKYILYCTVFTRQIDKKVYFILLPLAVIVAWVELGSSNSGPERFWAIPYLEAL